MCFGSVSDVSNMPGGWAYILIIAYIIADIPSMAAIFYMIMTHLRFLGPQSQLYASNAEWNHLNYKVTVVGL